MTESGTHSASNLWTVPECPFEIETSPRVLDDIRLAVVDAFFSLPRGGAEIGGVLLGRFQPGRLTVTGYAPLDCEHAFGPSFTLSPPDETRLRGLLAEHTHGTDGARPVGWYHSHTRSEIFLSDADIKIHNQYFPERWQVALVIRPHTFQPARIGYFFREADGSIHAAASYQEITLDAMQIRQVPTGKPTAAPVDQPPTRRWRPEPTPVELEPELDLHAVPAAATPAPLLKAAAPPPVVAVPDPTPEDVPEAAPRTSMDLPAPQFLSAAPPPSRRWVAILAIGVVLGAGAAGFQTRQAWLPRVMSAVNPAPVAPAPSPALGLNVIDRDGQLQITWDGNSRALEQAPDAMLEISDGPTPQAIQLDAAHLRAGSFAYARQTDKVDVKLIVHQTKGPDVREVTSFLGKLPEHKPVEDPEAKVQRDELAKEAAKLKLDLNWQTIKTKKLEKDLQSMREEMHQQQLKRLNNQLPDK
ncbi:MAG: Mov34/MPN/PAD family protein [Candidatus Solibacter sp.]|nr:Mov34/MPN/PAD family protein [Candidatus Solibacter sp.]